jgi:hypothetical protein
MLRREELLQCLFECVPISCDAGSYRCFVFFARSGDSRRSESSFNHCDTDHSVFQTHRERITHFQTHCSTIDSGLSTGAKAGIGSGVAIVVILLIAITFLVMKMRKRKQGVVKGAGVVPPIAEHEEEYYAHESQTGHSEMLAVDKPVEMVGSRCVAELPGSHGMKYELVVTTTRARSLDMTERI